jgi:hypothetical protein
VVDELLVEPHAAATIATEATIVPATIRRSVPVTLVSVRPRPTVIAAALCLRHVHAAPVALAGERSRRGPEAAGGRLTDDRAGGRGQL